MCIQHFCFFHEPERFSSQVKVSLDNISVLPVAAVPTGPWPVEQKPLLFRSIESDTRCILKKHHETIEATVSQFCLPLPSTSLSSDFFFVFCFNLNALDSFAGKTQSFSWSELVIASSPLSLDQSYGRVGKIRSFEPNMARRRWSWESVAAKTERIIMHGRGPPSHLV